MAESDVITRLETAYCPPLDPALLSAILSDYDLSNIHDAEAATQVLEELKDSATLEEQTDFDPSGTGASHGFAGVATDSHDTSNLKVEPSNSSMTDPTSISNGVSSLDLGESAEEEDDAAGKIRQTEQLENLDDETKNRLLQDLFGEQVSQYTVKHTLKKCGGKWQMAMEELLSHVYFSEAENSDDGTKMSLKGVDGFSEEKLIKRVRKARSKNQRLKGPRGEGGAVSPESYTETVSIPPNKWKNASEDIEFISSRTGIASVTVHSFYNEHNASVSKTIGALLKVSMDESKLIVTDERAVHQAAQALGRDFPKVAPEYLATLVRLTHPSTSAAHELAEALTTKPKLVNGGGGGIQVVPRYAPVVLNDENTSPYHTVSRKPRSTASSTSPPRHPYTSTSEASAYDSVRSAAFAQARAAHRKAKSNHLMGGAAAYYGERGREYAALSSRASAAAADSLAASQSSATHVDLHGVDVLNAVRIAQQRVHAWWAGLGESRVNGRVGAADRSSGYRIIVGAGRHSEGGKGKLGPAVSKTLRQDGWRFENAGAVIVVDGRAR